MTQTVVYSAPSLFDYALIGNLRTAALISRSASIDWLCWPEFASPSVFARLLDAHRGGSARVRTSTAVPVRQTYLPRTNVLRTRFRGKFGFFDLFDFFPAQNLSAAAQPAPLLRWIPRLPPREEVIWEVEPRWGYGARPARVERGRTAAGGWWLLDGSRRKLWVGGPTQRLPGEPSLLRLAQESGSREAALYLTDSPRSRPEEPLDATLRRTLAAWRQWVGSPHALAGPVAPIWRRMIQRSELTLKLLSSAQTGAFIAAPTTSLPEWPGADRNWDYRYVWIRDAALCAQVLLALGHNTEASAFTRWVIERALRGAPDRLRVVYDAHGRRIPRERTLTHLEGFAGSRPVRVGNGASHQFQLDIYGELFQLAERTSARDKTFAGWAWPRLRPLALGLPRIAHQKDRGIWEIRALPAHYVHSQVMGWVGLHAAAHLAHRAGDDALAQRLNVYARARRKVILERGLRDRGGGFRQAFEKDAPDAANLRIPLVGFLPFDDPRVRATLHDVEEELSHGPWVYRYRGDDGIRSPEGAFLACSFWRVIVLAQSGRREEARQHLRALLQAASPLGLWPEEWDPASRQPLGNYPQALTHLAALHAIRAVHGRAFPHAPFEDA